MANNIIEALDNIDVALGGTAGDAINLIDSLNQIGEGVNNLKSSVDNINGVDIKICGAGEYNVETGVPTVEDPVEGVFYLTPASSQQNNNIFNEYYIKNGQWEMFGGAGIDVSSLFDLSDRMAKGVDDNNGAVLDGAIVEGDIAYNKASSIYAHAEGGHTTASNIYTHAEGGYTRASGSNSHAEGSGTTASGIASHAEGSSTKASGSNSHAEGQNTIASGIASHAEGSSTKASGNYSHAEGCLEDPMSPKKTTDGTITYTQPGAYGKGSHSEGINTVANSRSSHAEGYETFAASQSAHAEGNNTKASNNYSHAEGNSTVASGEASHAEGVGTTASGNNSHAEGNNTTASHKSQHVFGEFNIADDSTAAATSRGNYVEIVGNGTPYVPSNARTLDWSGNESLAGSLTLGKGTVDEMTITAAQLKQLIEMLLPG